MGTGPGIQNFSEDMGQKGGDNSRQPLFPAKRALTLDRIWISIRYPWELVY